MTTDSINSCTTDIGIAEFCSFITDLIKLSLPLSLFHFARDVDTILSPLLPNRDDHLTGIVEQAFKVSIKSSQLRHYLLIFKQAACNEALAIWHTKNTNAELAEYVTKKITHSTDVSHQYCSCIQIEPANSSCPNCNIPFKTSSVKAKVVPTFCIDGQVKKATIYSYRCTNKQSACNLDAYPNFYTCNQGSSKQDYPDDSYRVTYQSLFEHSNFIYLGGGYAFEKTVLDNMSNLLHLGHVAFLTFERTYNLLSTTTPNPPLERRLLERIFLIYSMIQFEFFMGNDHAFLPRHIKLQLDTFIDLHFDRWYNEFVTFWANHSFLKPCRTKCTNAIIIDGHMKLKRRLCYNQKLPLVPPRPFELVFDTIIVGCPETPDYNSKFCGKCVSSSSDSVTKNEKRTRQIRQQTNSLSELSCNVNKEDFMYSDGYLRSCGVLLIATNCQIVVGFAEILRSETKKEVVQALANIYYLAPTLPRYVVYDAGCLLIKFIKANFNDLTKPNLIRSTPETNILCSEVKWMIDRFHLQNHIDKFCHTELNPDRDPAMIDVNTGSCEQVNSWIKHFSHILSNMNKSRFRITLLLIVHLRNCDQLNVSFRTMKARDILTQLLLLVSDQGYLNHPSIVFETLTDIDNNSSFTDGYGQIWRKPAPVMTNRDHDLAIAIHNDERRQYQEEQLRQQQQQPRHSQGYYPEQTSRKHKKKQRRPSSGDDYDSGCILS